MKESSCQRDDFDSPVVLYQDIKLLEKDSSVSSILAREKRQFLGTTCAIGNWKRVALKASLSKNKLLHWKLSKKQMQLLSQKQPPLFMNI